MIAAIIGASVSFAQDRAPKALLSNASSSQQLTVGQAKARKGFQTLMKSTTDGVYYGRPQGAFYRGTSPTGGYYYYDIIYVAPGQDIRFPNRSADPSSTSWYIGESGSETAAAASLLDGNDFILPTSPEGAYYSPQLRSGSITYQFGEESSAWGTANGGSRIDATNGLSMLSFVDPAMGKYYAWNGASFADGDGTYWFGTNDSFTDEGITYLNDGVYQIFDKPASPLYLESILCPFISTTEAGPLKGDAKLTIRIFNAVDNGSGRMVPGSNLIAEMTCGADDITDFETETPTGASHPFSFGMLNFANWEADAFGVSTQKPVIIDDAFAVLIFGFQDEGVDVGLYGCAIPTADVDANGVNGVQATRMTMINSDTKESGDFTVGYGSYGAAINLNGLFDFISVVENVSDKEGNTYYDQANVFRAETTAGSTLTSANSAIANDWTVPQVVTALPWVDDEGNYNYTVEAPDWITVEGTDVTKSEEYQGETYTYRTGEVNLTISYDALPASQDGRKAEIYIVGKGVTSDTPIVILQGDVTGIDNVSVDRAATVKNAVYNLAGQRVDKSYKGIVVKNGKKIVQ